MPSYTVTSNVLGLGGLGNQPPPGWTPQPSQPAQSTASSGWSPEERDYYNRIADTAAEQSDRDYKQKKQELDQNYKIAKQNAKTNEEKNAIDKWYNEQSIAVARERIAEDARQKNQQLAFDREVQAQNFGLAQAKQGYDLLAQQAQLRGPENYYQAAEYARGVAAQPGTATFLKALQDNTHLAGYGAQAGTPDRANVNALAARLGYTGPELVPGAGPATAGSGTNDTANLSSIGAIGAAGAHKLGAGSLEQLTDTEKKLLESGLAASGFDVPTFLQQYARSRIGQGYSNPAAA